MSDAVLRDAVLRDAVLIDGVVHEVVTHFGVGVERLLPSYEETYCGYWWTSVAWRDEARTGRPVDCLACIAKRRP